MGLNIFGSRDKNDKSKKQNKQFEDWMWYEEY